MRRLIRLLLALVTLGVAPAQAGFTHEADRSVVTRDGTRLSAHVFGSDDAAPKPVILAFTPYAVQELLPRARFFAANGYVFVAVSARGRGDSAGEFAPFSAHDGPDAADAIAWAAAQPWSNGKVGMWGGSYLGYSQWAALGQRPPALKTIVPAAAVFPGVDYPAWRQVNLAYQFQWLAALQGRSDWFDTAFDDEAWAAAVKAQRTEGRAFADLAGGSGTRADIARRWLAATPADWQQSVGDTRALGGLDIPVLAITGQFDADQRGAIAHVRRWLAANPGAAGATYTVIGPWDHGGTRTPAAVMAGEAVDPQSVIDMNALHLAWYDWTLKGGPKPAFLANRLVYFTLGSGVWQSAPALDAFGFGVNLHPATGTDRMGRLVPKAPRAVFRYSLDTRKLGSANPIGFEAAPGDTRDIATLGADGLVFDTDALAEDMVLAGFPRLSARLSTSRLGGDVFASLLLVAPDGKSTRIGFDVARLERLAGTAPQPREVVFDALGFVARRVPAGSRIRLVLHSNPPAFLEANPGNGGIVAQDRLQRGGPQTISLHHAPALPTALFLPLRPEGSASR